MNSWRKFCAKPLAAENALHKASDTVMIQTRLKRSASQPMGTPRAV